MIRQLLPSLVLLMSSPATTFAAENPDAGKMARIFCYYVKTPGDKFTAVHDTAVLVVQRESKFETDASYFVEGNDNYSEILAESNFDLFFFANATSFYNDVDSDYRLKAEQLFANRGDATRSHNRILGNRPVDSISLFNHEVEVFAYSPRNVGSIFAHPSDDGVGFRMYSLYCEPPWAE